MLPAALLAVLIVNLWTFWRFHDDKRRAIFGLRRIPEKNLLGLALAGGAPAAFLARHVFRHKTRKQPFSMHLWLIAAIQAGAAIGWAAAAWG